MLIFGNRQAKFSCISIVNCLCTTRQFISFAIIVLLVQIKNYTRHHIAICAVLFLYNFNHKGVDGCTIADFALTIAFFNAISTDFVRVLQLCSVGVANIFCQIALCRSQQLCLVGNDQILTCIGFHLLRIERNFKASCYIISSGNRNHRISSFQYSLIPTLDNKCICTSAIYKVKIGRSIRHNKGRKFRDIAGDANSNLIRNNITNAIITVVFVCTRLAVHHLFIEVGTIVINNELSITAELIIILIGSISRNSNSLFLRYFKNIPCTFVNNVTTVCARSFNKAVSTFHKVFYSNFTLVISYLVNTLRNILPLTARIFPLQSKLNSCKGFGISLASSKTNLFKNHITLGSCIFRINFNVIQPLLTLVVFLSGAYSSHWYRN